MSELVLGRFIKFGTDPDGVHGRLIPANFTPAQYVPAQVAAEGTDKISAHLKGIDVDLSKISPQNVVVVKKNPRVGEFSSIKAAVDSVTTASASNPFVVMVGPGVYTEDTITMKSYVLIIGSDDSSTIIEVDDPSKTLIIGATSTEVKNCQLRGPTDPGVPLIYHQGTTASYSPFSLVECAFGNADILIHVEGDGNPTLFRMEGCRVVTGATFDKGVVVNRSGVGYTIAFVSNFVFQNLTGPYPARIFEASGGVRLAINQSLVETNALTTHGIHIFNGAQVDMISSTFEGMDVAVHVENVGSAPTIRFENVSIRNCNDDLLIEHPGTIGNFLGVANFDKVTIDDSAPFTVSYSDLNGGGSAFSGPFYMGRKHSYLTDVLDLLEAEPSMGVMDGGALTAGAGFQVNVAAGFGYVMVNNFPDHRIGKVSWNNTSITLSANQDVYVFFNSSGILSSAATISNSAFVILLGRVVTNGSGIELIDESPLHTHHPMNHADQLFRDALGPIYDTGSIVTENATPFKLDVTAGVYFFSLVRFTPSSGTAFNFTEHYQDGLGGWTRTVTDTVNSANYDDGSGILAPLTSGYYVKHTLYVNGDGANQKFLLVLGQAEYSALAAVEDAPLPTPPTWFKDGVVPLASIVIKEGDANIVEVLDLRPRIGFKSSGVSASADHGSLLGLSDDDHPQYLLATGARALSGNLDLGGNNIVNVNLVDGVDVSAHASRHLPNGADPITTAIAVGLTANSVSAVGTANSLSRSDHVHAIATGVVSTQTPAQANAAGTSANLARADHIHNIPVATPVTIGSANAEGVVATFARSDHVHDHGALAGGDRHAVATGSVAGFMSAADKTKLDGISGTRIIKSGRITAVTFAGNPKTATVTFGAAFPNTNYTFFISGTDVRSWSWESKLAGSIVINTNANQALTGEVHWFAISDGESVE